MDKQDFLKEYQDTFKEPGKDVFFSPGRINVIGEHTDYNGGHVFPCALTIGTYAIARKNNDGVMRMYSMNFEKFGVRTVPAKDFVYKKDIY